MEIKERISAIEADIAKLKEERQNLNKQAGQMQAKMNEVDIQTLKKEGALEELKSQLPKD